MATTGNTWETVGKNPKNTKKSKGSVPPSKIPKKIGTQVVPKIDTSAAVKESKTIYDAFIDKEKKTDQQSGSGSGEASGAKKQSNGVSKKPASAAKKKSTKRENQGISLEMATKELDVNELKQILEQTMTTFPDNHSVWLKDLVSYVNIKLDRVAEGDPVFADQPTNYPSCLIPSAAKKMLNSTLADCTMDSLELFFEHCMHSMVKDLSKGVPTYGYRLFIQLMVRQNPALVTSKLPKYLDLLRSNQNHPLRCLSVMWALGQAATVSVKSGLRVWLDAMLPVLGIKTLATYSVEYLEKLFRHHTAIKPSDVDLTCEDYFQVLDVVYSSGKLQNPLQKRLQALYPKLKDLAFGTKPHANLRNFFPSYLKRLSTGSNQHRDEVLRCLVKCLASDKHCYSLWRQLYTTSHKESSVMLRHLVEHWDAVSPSLDRKLLLDTIQPFSITNEELIESNSGTQETLQDCTILLDNLRSASYPWFQLVLCVISMMAALISLDVYLSKGFEGSTTYSLLEKTGALTLTTHIVSRMKVYGDMFFQWGRINVPIFWNKLCQFFGPYLQLLGSYLKTFGNWLVVVSQPGQDWFRTNAPLYLEQARTFGLALRETVLLYGTELLSFVRHYSLVVWDVVVSCVHTSNAWLQENIFAGSWSYDNIQKASYIFLGNIQESFATLSNWLSDAWKNTNP